jgi:hypothetical protein
MRPFGVTGLALGDLMNTFPEIDAEILALVSFCSQKVAMIIARASRAASILKVNVAHADDLNNFIAFRIETLVFENKLVFQGDLKSWRHSEVCLA